jgi:hypothetical protein
MLTKILFTALVIAAVVAFYGFKRRLSRDPPQRDTRVQASRVGRFAAYGIVVLILVVSGVIFTYQWQRAHEIVTIRVIEGDGSNVTVYEAYRKSIKGNRFDSLDGKSVVLGEAQRVEFIDGD